MEALNKNVRTEPPMVQKEDTAQLMKKIEQTVSQNMATLEQAMSQKMAALIQGMSQRTTTRGIEIGQGSGQQPQVEVTTNIDIPIVYLVDSTTIPEERPTMTETHRMRQPQEEQVIMESPRVESPRVEPPRVEQPRVEPPRVDSPRFEQPRIEPPRVNPPRFEQPREEPLRMEPPRFEPQRVDPPRFKPPRMEPPRFEPQRVDPPRFEPQEWNRLGSSSLGSNNQGWNPLDSSQERNHLGWDHLNLDSLGQNRIRVDLKDLGVTHLKGLSHIGNRLGLNNPMSLETNLMCPHKTGQID